MPILNRSALVPFTAKQMFNVVDDVDNYSEFLPWCGYSKELSRIDNVVDGTVTLSKGPVNKVFTTRNILHKPNDIEIKLIEGPFKYLKGFWRFDEIDGQACKISLELDYEISNRLVDRVIGTVFDQIANTLVNSFVERANSKYG